MNPHRDAPAAPPRRRFYRSWLAFRLALWCFLAPSRARRALARALLGQAVGRGVLATGAFVVAFVGCRDLQPAIDATNAAREVGVEAAAVIDRECTARYLAAAELAPADAGRELLYLDRIGCPDAARAHDTYRAAHRAAVASLQAIQAGRCPAGATEPACDLPAALAVVASASAELVDAARRLEAGR